MKLVIGILTLLSVQFTYACDMFSSQIYAKIQSIELAKENLCLIKVSWSDQFHFNPGYDCPLEIGVVSSHGILTSCDYKVGDWITGIVYRSGKDPIEKIFIY